MEPTWILVADEGHARILEPKAPGQALVQIEELTDAAAHADEADLRRDAQGRFYGKGEQFMGHTAPPRTDPLEKEAGLFARRVAERLREAHHKHRFAQLRIAAAPKFLGRLRQEMDQEVRGSVVEELDKDLSNLDVTALSHRFAMGQAHTLRG